jgi:alkanesulfonate monooxygenase SsuD/methylene tetrahydromethanopterin reductase-like flavin-dependent oxidoreductase (luciferase family)
VRLGVLLPTFRDGAHDAFEAARAAAGAGVDGVFAYDHLWPMGSPLRPSLAPVPLLAAVARRHEQLVVGPLVARIGLVGTAHLVEQFATLEAIAPGRVIAAMGTGDKLSAPENDAYGLAHQGADERRALLRDAAEALAPLMPVWIGAGAEATNQLARELGAPLNVWDASIERVREIAASGAVTWAGPAPKDLFARLDALASAGATWAIFSPGVKIDQLGEWRKAPRLSKFP